MANYGYMNGGKASNQMHRMVLKDPEEARQASKYHYNNGRESYIVETSVVEHVAGALSAEYSYGVKHAQNYGFPAVEDPWRAQPPEVSTDRGFGGYPTKDKFKDFDGANDAYEYPTSIYDTEAWRARPPEVSTDRGFGGYPTKNTFKDFDGVNDAYEYPVSVYDTEFSQPDDLVCPPGSDYCFLKKPPVHNYPEKGEPFVPGFQTRASQPTQTASFNSHYYARPNSFDDYKTPGYDVYDKDKSGENPVFSKLRDLYLEYREGKNPNNKSSDDNRRPDRPSKPTGHAGTAMNFPVEGNKLPNFNSAVAKQPQLNGPVSSPQRNNMRPEMAGSFQAAKEHGRYSPPPNPRERVSSTDSAMANPKSKDDYGKSNHPLSKFSNVNPLAAKQLQFTGPVFSTRENNIQPKDDYRKSSPDGGMTNIKSEEDYRKSNHPLRKPTGHPATAKNFAMEAVNKLPNVNPAAAKQPQLIGPVSSPPEYNIRPEMTESFDPRKQQGYPGNRVSRTGDGDNHKNSSHLLSKPTGNVETAMNYLKEGNNKSSNVPAAAKPARSWGTVLPLQKHNTHPEKTANLEGAKQHAENYSTSPPNLGEKKSRFIGSKEAVEKYDGAFVPHTYN